MRILVLILLLFLSSPVFSQSVIKERLIGWSNSSSGPGDIPGCYYDSTIVHYPDKHSENGFEFRNGHFTQLNWQADYDSFSVYSCVGDKIIQEKTQYYFRNKQKAKMQVLELNPEGDSLSHLKTQYVKGTDRISAQEYWVDYGNNTFMKANFFKINWDNGLATSDSNVHYFPFDTTVRLTEYFYKNEKVISTRTTDYEGFPLINPIVNIDSTLPGYEYTERYQITNGVKTNHTIKKRFTSEANGSFIQLDLSYNGTSWDTVYNETRLIDSFQNGQLIHQINLSRSNPNEEFRLRSKVIRSYTNNLLAEQKIYYVDSNGFFYLFLTIKSDYDNRQHLIYQKITNEVSMTGSETTWTYSELGNITSRKVENFGPQNYGFSLDKYYYEPYLEKEINLNYSQLVPIAYPNPFKTGTNILFSCVPNKAGNITIYNSEGQIIDNHSFNPASEIYQYRWDAVGQPKGIYFARIIMGKEIKTIKLIKK